MNQGNQGKKNLHYSIMTSKKASCSGATGLEETW